MKCAVGRPCAAPASCVCRGARGCNRRAAHTSSSALRRQGSSTPPLLLPLLAAVLARARGTLNVQAVWPTAGLHAGVLVNWGPATAAWGVTENCLATKPRIDAHGGPRQRALDHGVQLRRPQARGSVGGRRAAAARRGHRGATRQPRQRRYACNREERPLCCHGCVRVKCRCAHHTGVRPQCCKRAPARWRPSSSPKPARRSAGSPQGTLQIRASSSTASKLLQQSETLVTGSVLGLLTTL